MLNSAGTERSMEGRNQPFFSIVIPTCDSATPPKDLKATLDSIVDQTYRKWEIIVVDNFSRDQTTQLASAYPARLFHMAGPISVANNFGMREARGDYILFLDSDQELPRRFLEECAQLVQREGVDCIGYRQLICDPQPSNPGLTRCNRFHSLERFLGAEPSDGIYCYSRNIIGESKFPEELRVMEDYYFRRAILQKHPKIGYLKSIVRHHRPQSFRWFVMRALQYGRAARKMKTTRLSKKVLSDYFPLTKRNTETRIDVDVGLLPAVLFLPFLLLKYLSFSIGFLLEQVQRT